MVHQNLAYSNAWNPFKMHASGPSQGPSGHLPSSKLMRGNGNGTTGFSRDMLTLKHFFKIQSLPNSPTHHAVIGLLGDPTPRMEHINKLCTQYQVQTPKILTNVVPEIPSWTYPPTRNYPFLETKKQGLLDKEMRAIFLAHLERHPTLHIYTDGSKSTEGVGFAAVFPNHQWWRTYQRGFNIHSRTVCNKCCRAWNLEGNHRWQLVHNFFWL